MPRKRKTVATTKRPKVVVPDGEESREMDKDDRKAKLQVLLRDFDQEVETRISELRTMGDQMIQKLEASCNMALCKIPKNIREMKVTDFLEAGGTIDLVAMRDAEKLMGNIAQSVAMGSAGKSKGDNTTQLTTIAEEENHPPFKKPTTARPKRARGKKTTTTALNTSLGPPPTTGRQTRTRKHVQQFETPVHGAGPGAAGWETPLITPKFDPRLPFTPAVTRDPKPGERIMSLAGSPLANKQASTQQPEIYLPAKNKTLQLTSSTTLEEIEEVDIDDSQLAQLEALQKKIAKFINMKNMKQN